LNQKKKLRYKQDPSYRSAARKRVREKYKQDNLILDDGGRIVYKGKKAYVAYKLSAASEFLGINNNTFRGYFDNGHIPLVYFDNTKLKLVSIDQLALLYEFVEACKEEPVSKVAKKMKDYLNQHWLDRGKSEEIINQNNG
jgi:hypothetical protein